MSVLNLSISKQMCNSNLFWKKERKEKNFSVFGYSECSSYLIPLISSSCFKDSQIHRSQFTATWLLTIYNLTPINHKPTVYLLQNYFKLSISFILNGLRHPEERWFLTVFRRNASILLGAAWLPEPSKSSAGPITRRHSFKRSSFPER